MLDSDYRSQLVVVMTLISFHMCVIRLGHTLILSKLYHEIAPPRYHSSP